MMYYKKEEVILIVAAFKNTCEVDQYLWLYKYLLQSVQQG